MVADSLQEQTDVKSDHPVSSAVLLASCAPRTADNQTSHKSLTKYLIQTSPQTIKQLKNI